MSEVLVRRGTPTDIEPAVEVWRAANTARWKRRPFPPEHEERVRNYVGKSAAFFFVANDGERVMGVTAGMQGLAEDGAGPPVDGLCHIAMVFVAPERWGEGIGGMLVEAALDEARSRGYEKAQLWTHKDNDRAMRLYERYGFERSGREKKDDLDERIVHYEREL